MRATPVRRRWTDTGEEDEAESFTCSVCVEESQRASAGLRSCRLCGDGPSGFGADFLNVGAGGTVCFACLRLALAAGPEVSPPPAARCAFCRQGPSDGGRGLVARRPGVYICTGCLRPMGVFVRP